MPQLRLMVLPLIVSCSMCHLMMTHILKNLDLPSIESQVIVTQVWLQTIDSVQLSKQKEGGIMSFSTLFFYYDTY